MFNQILKRRKRHLNFEIFIFFFILFLIAFLALWIISGNIQTITDFIKTKIYDASPQLKYLTSVKIEPFNNLEEVLDFIIKNKTLIKELQNQPEILDAIKNNPQILKTISDNQEILKQISEYKAFIEVAGKQPEILKFAQNNKELIKQIQAKPELLDLIKNHSNLIDHLKANEKYMDIIKQNPQMLKDLYHIDDYLFNIIKTSLENEKENNILALAVKNATLINSFTKNLNLQEIKHAIEFYKTVDLNKLQVDDKLIDIIKNNYEIFEVFLKNPDYIKNLNDNQNIINAIQQNPDLIDNFKNFDFDVLVQKKDLVRALIKIIEYKPHPQIQKFNEKVFLKFFKDNRELANILNIVSLIGSALFIILYMIFMFASFIAHVSMLKQIKNFNKIFKEAKLKKAYLVFSLLLQFFFFVVLFVINFIVLIILVVDYNKLKAIVQDNDDGEREEAY
ncbi:hypothetical protein [Ureaplasma urealyticum]|uniref:Uncharacterized protein n=1 Tax=Ureaplasma urealyticum serovar 10 (strain ATCC 33699 / Western) TaxID=565575 RepID=B5ZB81_UREU1|nr:hypothetical protein [Ureaplasma urealyticum]ACI59967.1 conserved hypothetical protein [Ureaplasma urealyticum serovar 10 str. ATCC 33699]EEH02230.1 conserved hypothetical protein [Ureaplasma urealyticum serovar 2 str. ATCC 27814]MDU3864744.1 hypothetical protein [Ureaplasma urealyticum]UNT66470.1 hypothetical protein IF687_01300 [Ureaplasma urealyticum]